ncbi:MAG: RES domain-containing protein [Trueperaceae bacterium]|nr:MAG: RES domain-containing protein [Trueperaceae bacterium]
MRAYRLVEARHAEGALSGEGAFVYGGRWNPPGYRLVYTAAHLSLAVLEVLVHTGDRVKLLDYYLIRLEIPAEHLEMLSPHALPRNWPEQLETTRELGREWLAEARSLALVVPSVVIPEEENVLLNPAHPAMGEVEASAPEPFKFDPRLC